jgi:hypothetical protein
VAGSSGQPCLGLREIPGLADLDARSGQLCLLGARAAGGLTSHREGFPQDALFGCGVKEIEHEPGDEFWVVGDGDVAKAVEPPELRVGDKREKAGIAC